MPLPRGMLLDLDDTIVAFDAVSEPVWESLCVRYSPRVHGSTYDELLAAIQRARKWYWSDATRHKQGRHDLINARRDIVRLALEGLGLDDEALSLEMADTYSKERDAAVCLFPGAKETLQHLIKCGVSLALITNGRSDNQRNKIKQFGLERFFVTIMIEGELGYGKPDPQVYLRALGELQLNSTDVWAVGDNLEWDVAAPQKLGIYSIWNDYRNQGLFHKSLVVPDRIINNISELVPVPH